MGALDPASLLAPVDSNRPCGQDLEYDSDYLAFGQAAQGKPERQMGDQVLPPEQPNWKEVRRLALQLLTRTKDLRIAVPLCRAVAHTDGIAGFASGLKSVRGMVEQFWPTLYPLLDADDHDDPTMRVNALTGLCDPSGTLKTLRETPLVSGRVAGSFSLRDVEVAAGRLPPADGTAVPSTDLIRAAFQEVAIETLQGQQTAIAEAKQAVQGLGKALSAQLGGQAPDLDPLEGVLSAMEQELARQLQDRGVVTGGGDGGSTAAVIPGAPPKASATEIRSRDDVALWLDRICDFYRRNEPSSPVPLLLQRARKLMNKNFLDVIRDLTPDALGQAETFRGPTEDES